MAEYIEREEYCEKHCRCSNEYCDRVSCPIWKAPAADVAPVVRGRWKAGRFNLETGNYEEQCTRCRNFSKEYDKPYCPNCGAKMDGESTEGDAEHGMGSKE